MQYSSKTYISLVRSSENLPASRPAFFNENCGKRSLLYEMDE
ncbi:hypothetical protein HMPREF1981_02630 [Bacteroides pyogenes F0041]|uniref:Uncharacterized protein n=1 Tax=Bacteroides pyogenes F0041 TaxID=1321819 RepID=U2DKR8_9BACE|nr:hypothetical protein HMPREF1981_02630 [Bacteroides pyogenes F0041]